MNAAPRFTGRLRRAFRELFATRAIEAAAPGGRPWSGMAGVTSIAQESTASLLTIRRRARQAYANIPVMTNGTEAWVSALMGDHWQIKIKDAALRPIVMPVFERWARQCGPSSAPSLNALATLLVRSLALEGEGWALTEIGPDRMPRYRPLAPDQIDPTLYRELGGGRRIEAGIEVGAGDEPEFAHVSRRRPGTMMPMPLDTVRVPYGNVLHIFNPIEAGQLRGAPWAMSVLLKLHALDKLHNAGVTQFEVATLNSIFMTPTDGGTGPYQGTATDGKMQAGMEPGAILVTPPGMTIEANTPAAPQGLVEFSKAHERQIAAGYGLPYHVLSGDVSEANYSSARVALIEWRRRVASIQQKVLIVRLFDRMWRDFVTMAVLTGRLPPADPERYAAEWLPPAFDWVDPLKDIQAELQAIAGGIKSRAQVVAERGYDIDELDAEAAADQARAKRLGLNFAQAPAAQPARPAPPADDPADRALPAPALILRRAPLVSRTLDTAARTFEATAATETLVQRRDFDGEYFERLAVTPDAIDLASVAGIPVLDSHDRASLDSQIGVVLAARIENGALIAKVKLSARDAVKPIIADIADGIIVAVSVGYSVETWRDEKDPASGRRIRTAVKWTPRELSLVSIGADPSAKIRSSQ